MRPHSLARRSPLIAFALVLLLTIAGCGGGGSGSTNTPSPATATPPPPPPPPPPPTQNYVEVLGQVTAPNGIPVDEFAVVALGKQSSVSTSGEFSADVYLDAISLLLASRNDRTFGLARVIVPSANLSAESINLDSTSTAVSMVFLSPFVLTLDPDEAASRLALIEADSAISSLAQAIESAFNDAVPLENPDLRNAWAIALDSIAAQLTVINEAPSGIQKTTSPNNTAVVRLPKRSAEQLVASKQAVTERVEIDLEFTDIDIESSGNQYFLQPTSTFLNAVDWFVEVGEVDFSQYRFSHRWNSIVEDPLSVYLRTGQIENPVGIDINSARGFYQIVEFVKTGLNWLINHIQNAISPNGIAISQVNDGVYIVRSFSGGSAGSSQEHEFVQNDVPNGAINHRRARTINHLSVAMDIASIAYDFIPVLDDLGTSDCLKGALIELYKDTSSSIEITGSVTSEVITAKDITQELIGDWSLCLVGTAAITSVTGLSWINDVWGVVTGVASIPITGAQLTERYLFMVTRATPLESILIMVGSPIVDDAEGPSIPANIVGSAISTNQIHLQWNPSEDNDEVAEYVVYRDDQNIGLVSAPTLTDSGLSAGTIYCYTIEAFDFIGNPSGRSSPAVCVSTLSLPDRVAPTVPQNVTATVVSDTSIELSWEPSEDEVGVVGYEVIRSPQFSFNVTDPAAVDSGLAVGSQYCYTVVAFDAAGNQSEPSSPSVCATTTNTPDTTAPNVPMGVTATAISDSEIEVIWLASVDNVGVTGYRIFRDTVPFDTTGALSFIDGGLDGSTNYCYGVAAFDATGNESLPSSTPACATTLAAPDSTRPSVPPGLSVTADSSSRITISWQASTDNVGVVQYYIYRDDELHDTSVGLSFIDLALTASTSYCYAISAVDAAGNESFPTTQSCETTESAGSVSVSFTKVADTTTTVPGLSVPFERFNEARVEGSTVAFSGRGLSQLPSFDPASHGIYRFSGSNLTRIVDVSFISPDTNSAFDQFGSFAIDGANVVFLGNSFFTGWAGVYAATPTGLQLIANQETSVPGRNEPWLGFLSVQANDGMVAFGTWDNDGNYGIYNSNGSSIALVADMSTQLAGVNRFLSNMDVWNLAVEQGRVAFRAWHIGIAGIYVVESGNATLIVDAQTINPANGEPFDHDGRGYGEFNDISFDDSALTFSTWRRDLSPRQQHVLQSSGGNLDLLIDNSDTINGNPSTVWLHNFLKPLSKNNSLLFQATENTFDFQSNPTGIFIKRGQDVSRLIMQGDILDGQEVTYVELHDFDGSTFVFEVRFENGVEALYTGAISIP